MAEHPVNEPEEWRPVPGHPGYEASSLGRVRSVERWIVDTLGRQYSYPGVILRQQTHRGYRQVSLGRHDGIRINMIVCEAFHGRRPSGRHHAAHWNGSEHDNRASNLRWATPEQNIADKTRHGTLAVGAYNGSSKLTEADVIAIRRLRASTGLSLRAIGDRFGISKQHVRRITGKESWKHLP